MRFAGFCTEDVDCDDGAYCNGEETCDLSASVCRPGFEACPGRYCDESADACVECLYAFNCDDGDACNGSEICVGGSCMGGTPLVCDDGADCTDDSCDPDVGCVYADNCPLGDVCNVSTGLCQPGPAELIGTAATWAYWEEGDDPEVDWTALGFDDSAWRYGTAQLGYGDGDEATVVECGPTHPVCDADNFPATYFRKSFDLADSYSDVSDVNTLTLHLLRDDGAIVYLNGTEIQRDNMPEGAVDYLTFASTTVSGGDEVVFFSSTEDPATLVNGVNIVAVEIHQATATSSDISFDLRLVANTMCDDDGDCADGNICNGAESCVAGLCIDGMVLDCDDGVTCTTDTCDALLGCENVGNCPVGEVCNEVLGVCEVMTADPLPIEQGDTWTYFKGVVEPTPEDLTAWAELGFDDDVTGWYTGPSGLGYGTDCPPSTLLDDMQDGYVSVYARRPFYIANPGAVVELTLTMDYDDSFTAYINGVEVARNNVDGTPPTFDTLANADHECSGSASPNPPEDYAIQSSFDLSTLLVPGANMLAIQAHNLTSGSSDFTLLPTMTSEEIGPTTTYTFQDGFDGYVGTADTFLFESQPDSSQGSAEAFEWDGDDPTGSGQVNYALIRFDDVFGTGAGQIAPGSPVTAASLTYTVLDAGDEGAVYEVLADWDEAVTFNGFGSQAGVQADEYDPVSVGAATGNPIGTYEIDVTSSLQAWSASPLDNLGWLIFTTAATSGGGVQVHSSEHTAEPALRPKLTVEISTGVVADPPAVEAVGSRYLAITPAAGPPSVALRIDSSSIDCMPMYVDANGLLTDTPVFQSATTWGTVYVADAEIIPSTTYQVQSDVRLPAESENLSDAVAATTWMWGDPTHDEFVDVMDIVCVLDGFDLAYGQCSREADDLMESVPDRVIDVNDLVAVLDAFAHVSYYGTWCTKGGAVASVNDSSGGVVSIVPASNHVRGGDRVVVDVYAAGFDDLRGYQISLDVVGRSGVVIESMHIDEGRGDYVFADMTSFPAVSETTGQLACATAEVGVDSGGRAYLGTFILRASKRAAVSTRFGWAERVSSSTPRM